MAPTSRCVIIGVRRMADMMLTGRVLSAEEGHDIGLSQYLVAPGTGLEKGIELAKKICRNTFQTNYSIMHALPRIAEANQDHGMFMEAMTVGIAQADEEAKSRLIDFLEKSRTQGS